MAGKFLSTNSSGAPTLARPGILEIIPYVGGRSIDEMERLFGRRDFLKVASNESPLGPSPRAVAALRRAIRETHLYPEQSYPMLTGALARKFRLKPENVFLGDGTSEIITLVTGAFLRPGDEAIMSSPSFVMHSHGVVAAGAKLVTVPLRGWKTDLPALARAVNRRTRIVFVCNPNNPTGTVVSGREVEGFLRALPGGPIVVFDEAYAEFCRDRSFPDTLKYVRRGLRVVVLRTFAKIAGLAGLRVGYAFAPPEIVGVLDRLRQPFNVNTLAYRAATAAVSDRAWERRTQRVVWQGREYLSREFRSMGLETLPSEANFVMVRVGDGPSFFKKLLYEGVIVRPLPTEMARPFIRITVGTMPQNRRIVSAVKRVLAKEGRI